MLTLAPPHAAAEELSDKAAAALRRMLAVEPRNTQYSSLLTPCQPGAPPVSVRRGTFTTG